MQLRVEGGAAQLRTRKGLDWTEKFPEIARAAGTSLSDGIYDGEVCAVDDKGRVELLGAAGARCRMGRPNG